MSNRTTCNHSPAGILVLDKPAGLTSAAVLNDVKRLLPHKTKIGHAGTLDPFATGVLLAMIGPATRLSEALMDQPKVYQATVRFGATTPTDDSESSEIPHDVPAIPTPDELRAALVAFVGVIDQVPPVYSAKKIGGKRACDLARDGKPPALAPVPVRIDRIELLEYTWPLARIEIACGRGAYIRAIARDLGQALGVGAYLSQLRRTRVGPHDIADAVTPARLVEVGLAARLIPVPPKFPSTRPNTKPPITRMGGPFQGDDPHRS